MGKRISEEVREEVERLYDKGKGLSSKEIARQTGASYSFVHGFVRAKKEGFASPEDYKKHLAKKEGFASVKKYKEHLARQRINPETGKLHASLYDYNKYRDTQRINPETGKPFASSRECNEYLARQRINPETGKPFASSTDYKKYQDKLGQERPENKKLACLIKRRLEELGKSQVWLSKKLGVKKQAVFRYIQGNSPRSELLGKLFSVLKVPYKTLDDLLEAV